MNCSEFVEQNKAMDAEEKKQYEKEKKEWEDTQRNSRHRDEVLADVRKTMSNGGASDKQINGVERIFNKQYRPKRFNNRILTKCKVCGKEIEEKRLEANPAAETCMEHMK